MVESPWLNIGLFLRHLDSNIRKEARRLDSLNMKIIWKKKKRYVVYNKACLNKDSLPTNTIIYQSISIPLYIFNSYISISIYLYLSLYICVCVCVGVCVFSESWQTSKDLYSLALYGHWMQSRSLGSSNKIYTRMVRESQRTPCYQFDLMIMIYIYIYDTPTNAITHRPITLPTNTHKNTLSMIN